MTQTNSLTPARTGYYLVNLADGAQCPAAWGAPARGKPCQWRRFVLDDARVARWRALVHQPKYSQAYLCERPAQVLRTEPLEGEVVAFDALERTELTAPGLDALLEEECIARAWHEFNTLHPALDECAPVPAVRRIQRGDALEVGLLVDCRAEALYDEGRVVVFSHQHTPLIGAPAERRYRAAHWTRVLVRKAEPACTLTAGLRAQGTVDALEYKSTTLDSLLSRAVRGLDDAPDFQRGYVWSDEDRARYLESVFTGVELGRFILVRRPWPHRTQVLDGKQRLRCLVDFYTSRLAWRGRYWHDLSAGDRDFMESRRIQVAELHEAQMTRAQLLRTFLNVNVAGVPQLDEHLAHVRALLVAEEARERTIA